MADLQALQEALDELDEHELQRLVNDTLARRRIPGGSEAGLAEARRRFGDDVNSGRSQR